MTEYLSFETLLEQPYVDQVCRLHDSIFVGKGPTNLTVELRRRCRFLVQLAVESDIVVGYKIGYEERARRFYSWLGGVHAEFRGQGIASELMRRQHEWCKEQGYARVRTQTKNKWRDMLILNLRYGFDVIGTYTDETGEPKIILEKRLLSM